MRVAISAVITFVAVALVICAWISKKSERDIAPKVTAFLISLLPPVIGNLIIIAAHTEGFALFGRYLYAIGIDITMFCLLDFTLQYCDLKWNQMWRGILTVCIAADIVQLMCNPFFGHAFAPDMMMVYGEPYYNVKSYIGRNIHLVLVYAIMAVILSVFLIRMIRGSRIYSEKYLIMFLLLLVTGLWEVFYILSRTPVKRTVIAYGVFGILVFWFSLYYRPMRLLDHLLADVASGLTDGLFFFDRDGKCVWADEHGMELIGGRPGDFGHYVNRINELFPNLEFEKSEWKCRRSLSENYYDLEKHTVYDNGKKVLGFVLSIRDETEDELALQKERYIANHDPLTGLYTKKHLFDKTRERIDANPDVTFYTAYLDINNFKFVNDIFGNDFGDYALQSIGNDLREKLPEGTLVGRIGGDSFGLCLSDGEFDQDLAEKYTSTFMVERGSISHRIVMHEGVYKVADRNIDVSVMFDRAKIALETIKRDYTKHIALYDGAMREKALWDQTIALQLPDALTQRQLRPYLQAIVDRDGNVIGAEALVRWIHPERGFLSPAVFIPVLEDNGMVSDVDRYMWRCASEILKRWEHMGRDDLFISVNVSPKDFYFMDVEEEFNKIVEEYGVLPSRLRIEITETAMINDSADKLEILKNLKKDGFVVEMDDFGSGYSSLNMLKDTPVDLIKIDMVFLKDMHNQVRSTTILHNVINMMTELGMESIVEGVETQEQFRILTRMGGKLFQGYLFAKPLPVEDFEEQFLGREESGKG